MTGANGRITFSHKFFWSFDLSSMMNVIKNNEKRRQRK